MKEGKARISKIVVEIGDKKVEFTLEEAKELAKVLGDMFDEKLVIERHVIDYPYRWWGVTYTVEANPVKYIGTNTDGQKWNGTQFPSTGEVTVYCSSLGNQNGK